MPIGNQEIWDKGIGAGATNVIFGGGDTQPSATNFNPGALGADPNAQPAATTATETPGSPEQPPTPETPQEPVENPALVAARNNFNMAQMKYQQAQQALSGNTNQYAKHAGMTLNNWRRSFFEAQQKYLTVQQQYGG